MKKKYKTAGVLSASDLKTAKGKIAYAFIIATLLVMVAVCLIPTIWVILTSLKDTREMYNNPGFIPQKLSMQVFTTRIKDAWVAMDVGTSALNSLVIALGDTIVCLVFCGLGGYALSRLKPRGTKIFLTLAVWTMMMPTQIRTVPNFMSYLSFPFLAEVPGEVSLINTYWPLWLSAACGTFTLLLFKNHFDSLPMSYVEAAKIDGCGNMRIFFNIMMPLSVPIMMYIAITTMQGAWGNFFGPYLILTDAKLQPLAVKLFIAKSDSAVKMNTYMMCLILASVPSFITFVLFQKHIVGGINVGGVKG